MRKLISILVLLGMLFVVGPALADSVSNNYYTNTPSHNSASDYTGNDGARAEGDGVTWGITNTFATGDRSASEMGFAHSFDRTRAYAGAVDLGQTSIAGAYVKTEGYALSFGLAKGKDWGYCGGSDYAESSTEVGVGGLVAQENWVNEVGYTSGTGASAGNWSGGSFVAMAWDSEVDYGVCSKTAMANSHEFISGSIKTGGFSAVTVDPYGSHQSAKGITANFVNVNTCGAEYYDGSVYGNGSLGLMAQSGGAYARVSGTFDYAGSHGGSGIAAGKTTVYNGGSYSTATSQGFSKASSY